MNFFRKKTEEDRGSSSSSLPRDDTASVSSKATSTNTTSKVELVKCYIPFEQPVNPIKAPDFELDKEQIEKYEKLVAYF